jgi:hypothetical protein
MATPLLAAPERDQLVRPRLRLANLDQQALDRDEHEAFTR